VSATDIDSVTISSSFANLDAVNYPEAIVAIKPPQKPPEHLKPGHYHVTVSLDPERVGLDASKIADEVITHLAGLFGSAVKVTLEIEAEILQGVPENVVRTVTVADEGESLESIGLQKISWQHRLTNRVQVVNPPFIPCFLFLLTQPLFIS
jgi:hypothetical protein